MRAAQVHVGAREVGGRVDAEERGAVAGGDGGRPAARGDERAERVGQVLLAAARSSSGARRPAARIAAGAEDVDAGVELAQRRPRRSSRPSPRRCGRSGRRRRARCGRARRGRRGRRSRTVASALRGAVRVEERREVGGRELRDVAADDEDVALEARASPRARGARRGPCRSAAPGGRASRPASAWRATPRRPRGRGPRRARRPSSASASTRAADVSRSGTPRHLDQDLRRASPGSACPSPPRGRSPRRGPGGRAAVREGWGMEGRPRAAGDPQEATGPPRRGQTRRDDAHRALRVVRARAAVSAADREEQQREAREDARART